MAIQTAQDVRLACRKGAFRSPTAGLAPGQIQANLLILPARYAADFRGLCQRNPVSCPLLGETSPPGNPALPTELALGGDIRTDLPAYHLYRDGQLVAVQADITREWQPDSVAFLIGCSFSFEAQLIAAGLPPKHVELECNVPMYRTSAPLCASGVFSGSMIVSMRPYRPKDVDRVRDITRPFGLTHGEPVAWGHDGAKRLGIDLSLPPDFGDAVPIAADEVPVFWGCGVTPQQAVMESGIPGIVIGHAPGYMLCLDMPESAILTS